MPVKPNYAGCTFGQITLDAAVENRPGYWKGRCSCGNAVVKRIDNLKRPGHHSCGKCRPIPCPLEPETATRVVALEEALVLVRKEIAALRGERLTLEAAATSD